MGGGEDLLSPLQTWNRTLEFDHFTKMFVDADLISWLNQLFKKKKVFHFLRNLSQQSLGEVGIQPGQVTSPSKGTHTTLIYSHTPRGNLDLETYRKCFWIMDPTGEPSPHPGELHIAEPKSESTLFQLNSYIQGRF